MEGKRQAPVPLITHVKNISHSIFPNVEVYVNNEQIYNSNGLCAGSRVVSRSSGGGGRPYVLR